MNDIVTKITATKLLKPKNDTAFAHASAMVLKDIVKQNGWAIKLGQGEHLKYEAWQTIGKYYGYTVRTGESNYVEYGEVKGFEAKAWVIDNKTGMEIGGAEAVCLNDEFNWKSKPLFQLKSMAQTRAGSKALRQILGFVVALAGYNPTPAEEMTEPMKSYNGYKPEPVREPIKEAGWIENDSYLKQVCEHCKTTGIYHKSDCPNRESNHVVGEVV